MGRRAQLILFLNEHDLLPEPSASSSLLSLLSFPLSFLTSLLPSFFVSFLLSPSVLLKQHLAMESRIDLILNVFDFLNSSCVCGLQSSKNYGCTLQYPVQDHVCLVAAKLNYAYLLSRQLKKKRNSQRL